MNTNQNNESLDPRVNRMGVLQTPPEFHEEQPLEQWQTYQVFHQSARGQQHQHVGIVHAPSPEMALLFAKEQYARRMNCVNIWVVKTADITASEYEDADMFEPAFDKSYREASGYKNTRQYIDKYKKEAGLVNIDVDLEDEIERTYREMTQITLKPTTVSSPSGKKAGIIVGKK